MSRIPVKYHFWDKGEYLGIKTAREIAEVTGGITTNIAAIASRGGIYRKRYLITYVDDPDRMREEKQWEDVVYPFREFAKWRDQFASDWADAVRPFREMAGSIWKCS